MTTIPDVMRKALGASAVVLMAYGGATAGKLYVYYPATVRPQVMQQKLSLACPASEVMVFGRYEDFKAKVDADKPDVILTKTPLVSQFAGYSSASKAVAHGKTDEEFVLLSVDTPVDPASVNATTVIGVIDFLGRAGMSDFVKKFLPVEPSLKRVTKVEDLLPLLTFKMAKAVIVSKDFVPFFKQTSQLKFVETPLPAVSSGIASIASKDASAGAIIKSVQGISQPAAIFPGVDSWK